MLRNISTSYRVSLRCVQHSSLASPAQQQSTASTKQAKAHSRRPMCGWIFIQENAAHRQCPNQVHIRQADAANSDSGNLNSKWFFYSNQAVNDAATSNRAVVEKTLLACSITRAYAKVANTHAKPQTTRREQGRAQNELATSSTSNNQKGSCCSAALQ
jgi:hypothetical protein